MIITFSLFGSSVFYRINLLMMIFGSHQISVNSFGLVLRPRLFSLLSSSLIGVSVLVGGSWIGKVSTCNASTTERTHLKQTKGEDPRCTMKNTRHWCISSYLRADFTTNNVLDIISVFWNTAQVLLLIIYEEFTYHVTFVITRSKSNIS